MKSLNRTLSLVLVLVMVFGLMGIASATTFTDSATVQYKEAVGVMTGIGAINGYTDGTFKPTATITREEAAKMITYAILGPTVAKTLTVTSTGFSDVAAGRWSAPFISYCVSKGIINGMGDGTFAPTANVTGYQVAKMLLCAVGYGKMNEYVGSGWELNVAVDANKNGIFTGAKTVSYTAAATREETALYVFNAITKIDQVQYVKLLDTYMHNGDTIAYEVYKLAPSTATPDTFGRPATTWTNGITGKTVATIANTPVLTYSAAVKPTTIKLALQNAGYTIGASAAFWTNGVGVTYTDVVGGSTPVANWFANTGYVGGNGCIAEVYVTSAGVLDRIVVINTHLAVVSGIAKDDATTTTVDERAISLTLNGHTITASPASTIGFDAAYTAAATAIAASKTCSLLVVPTGDATANGTALTLEVPKTAVLTATSFVAGSSFTAGGTTYKYSYTFNGTAVNSFAPFTAIFDNYGYVIDVTGVATAAAPLCSVVAYAPYTTGGLAGGTAYQAVLLFTDGTTKTVELTDVYSDTTHIANTYVSNGYAKWFTYKVETTGTYTLTPATSTVIVGTTAISNGVPTFAGNSPTTYTVNNATVFILRSGSASAGYTFAKYTGYKAVPNVSGASVLVNATGTVANYVYIYAGDTAAVADNSVKAVIMSTTPTVTYVNATTTTYTYAAAINGVVSSIVSKSPLTLTKGVLYSVNVGADGYVTGTLTSAEALGFAFAGADATSGVLNLIGTANHAAVAVNNVGPVDPTSTAKTAYTYTGAEYVFVIDTTAGTVSVSTVEALAAAEKVDGVNYTAYLAVNGTTSPSDSAIQAIWAVK